MCGIAVAIDWDGAGAAVKSLIAGLLHRGDVTDPGSLEPRDRRASAPGASAHRRPSRGVQPAASFDGRLLVAFNGRDLYSLSKSGAESWRCWASPFRTDSDTEVHGVSPGGLGFAHLPKLSGMYAFVAYDLRTGDFLAARDPLGRQAYLIAADAGFLFCSEIRPLLSTVETGDVMLLPPGHLLTKTVFAPFGDAVPASTRSRRPEPGGSRPTARKRRRPSHAARSAVRAHVQRRHRRHPGGPLRAAQPPRRRRPISAATRAPPLAPMQPPTPN